MDNSVYKVTAPGRLSFSCEDSKKRISKLGGTEYFVYPAVMMVEGAYYPKVEDKENPIGILFKSEELDKSVRSWNGRPVSIDHPRGSDSCNVPSIYGTQCIGYIFDTKYDTIKKSLKCDIWLDTQKADLVSESIDSGGMEVSIGAFGTFSDNRGEFDGVKYSVAIENISGDHLALLPTSKGACSWEDGCGVRAERQKMVKSNSETLSKADTSGCSCSKAAAGLVKSEEQDIGGKLLEKECKKMDDNKSVNVSSNDAGLIAASIVDKNMSVEDYIKGAPTAIRAVLNDAISEIASKREALLATIASTECVTFCKKFLATTDTKSLKNIAKLAVMANSMANIKGQPSSIVDYGVSNVMPVVEQERNSMPIPIMKWD
jgi:hypothetical protein